MDVVVATHHYFQPHGSERFTETLAVALHRRGHRVTVFAPWTSERMAEPTRRQGVAVQDRVEDLPERADLLVVAHSVTAYLVRTRYPTAPLFLVAHGVRPFLEQPPRLAEVGVALHLAVSEQVRARLLASGLAAERVAIFRNPVDTARFAPTRELPERPERLLVFGRKFDTGEHDRIATAAARLGLEVIGLGRRTDEEADDVVPHLDDADLVVTRGRGVLEAMACGRPAANLGDGLLHEGNVAAARRYNFSGLGRPPLDADGLVASLAGWSRELGAESRRYVVREHDADVAAVRLLELMARARELPPPPAVDRARVAEVAALWEETRIHAAELTRRRLAGEP